MVVSAVATGLEGNGLPPMGPLTERKSNANSSGRQSEKEQWIKLLDIADEIRAFISEHDAELKAKEPRESDR